MINAEVFINSLLSVAIASLVFGVLFIAWKVLTIDQKIDGLHDQLNGKMERLLHEYGKAERAAGVAQERTEERERHSIEIKEG